MAEETSLKIQDLSMEERLKLVEDIWDSIVSDQKALPLTTEQRQQLDRRLEAYNLDGDPGVPAIDRIEQIRERLD